MRLKDTHSTFFFIARGLSFLVWTGLGVEIKMGIKNKTPFRQPSSGVSPDRLEPFTWSSPRQQWTTFGNPLLRPGLVRSRRVMMGTRAEMLPPLLVLGSPQKSRDGKKREKKPGWLELIFFSFVCLHVSKLFLVFQECTWWGWWGHFSSLPLKRRLRHRPSMSSSLPSFWQIVCLFMTYD